jgi:hypothetical protein
MTDHLARARIAARSIHIADGQPMSAFLFDPTAATATSSLALVAIAEQLSRIADTTERGEERTGGDDRAM